MITESCLPLGARALLVGVGGTASWEQRGRARVWSWVAVAASLVHPH